MSPFIQTAYITLKLVKKSKQGIFYAVFINIKPIKGDSNENNRQ